MGLYGTVRCPAAGQTARLVPGDSRGDLLAFLCAGEGSWQTARIVRSQGTTTTTGWGGTWPAL